MGKEFKMMIKHENRVFKRQIKFRAQSKKGSKASLLRLQGKMGLSSLSVKENKN